MLSYYILLNWTSFVNYKVYDIYLVKYNIKAHYMYINQKLSYLKFTHLMFSLVTATHNFKWVQITYIYLIWDQNLQTNGLKMTIVVISDKKGDDILSHV